MCAAGMCAYEWTCLARARARGRVYKSFAQINLRTREREGGGGGGEVSRTMGERRLKGRLSVNYCLPRTRSKTKRTLKVDQLFSIAPLSTGSPQRPARSRALRTALLSGVSVRAAPAAPDAQSCRGQTDSPRVQTARVSPTEQRRAACPVPPPGRRKREPPPTEKRARTAPA